LRKGVKQAIQDNKKILRAYFKDQRNQLSEELWKKKSEIINLNLINSFLYRDFTKIAFYYPINREVDLRSSINQALFEKEVYLPRTNKVEKRLSFHRITSLRELVLGVFEIPEPSPNCQQIDISDLEVILVPGLAFDKKKGRLGYGGGYYDRALANFKGLKVGVAFSFQIVDELGLEEHDVRMDFILTEEGIF